MIKNSLKVSSILVFVLAILACNKNASSVVSTNTSINLQTVVESAVNSPDAKTSYVTGIPLIFQCNGVNNNQPISVSSGKMSTKANAPDLPANAIYQIGSSTKSFTAVIALQLETEGYFGKKGLDSTLGEVLGNLESSPTWNSSWNKISLRHLLNMTSGIPDCVDAAIPTYIKNPNYSFSTNELIGLVANKKADFEPGMGWKYSNTNYVIMNKVISYVTKSNIKEQITKRIINKLGLKSTYYVNDLPMDAITNLKQKPLLMSGYFGSKAGNLEEATDLSLFSLSITNAAGAIISNTADMNKYVHALFDDKNGLLEPNKLNELTSMVATESSGEYRAGEPISVVDRAAKDKSYGFGYGLGIMEFFVELPNGRSITFYAHGGDTLDFDSNWIYSPQKKAYAAYVFNSQAPNSRKVRAYIENQIYKKIDKECSPYLLKSK